MRPKKMKVQIDEFCFHLLLLCSFGSVARGRAYNFNQNIQKNAFIKILCFTKKDILLHLKSTIHEISELVVGFGEKNDK